MVVATTETQSIRINLQFQRDRSTWLALGAAGGLLVAAVLAAVTLGIAWATYDMSVSGGFGNAGGAEVEYRLFDAGAQGGSTKYSSSQLDEADGIGLVRAGGPLMVTGVVLGFVALLVTATSVFVSGFRLRLIGVIAAALAAVFLVLALVLFPIGIADMHEAGTQNVMGATITSSEISWGAGLILAIIAAVAALGATAVGFLSMRQASG